MDVVHSHPSYVIIRNVFTFTVVYYKNFMNKKLPDQAILFHNFFFENYGKIHKNPIHFNETYKIEKIERNVRKIY